MKKTFIVILVFLQFIACSFCFIGCNNSFKLVKSIKITTNGAEKTFSSSTKPEVVFIGSIPITEDEFDNAPNNRKYVNYAALSKISINEAIKSAKNSTSYEIVESELEGYYYFACWDQLVGHFLYSKRKYEKTRFHFVYVKVKNDTTVVIKRDSTETTYSVTSCSITYF